MAEAIFDEGINQRAFAACGTTRMTWPVRGVPSFGDANSFDFAAQRQAVSLGPGKPWPKSRRLTPSCWVIRPQGGQDVGGWSAVSSLSRCLSLGLSRIGAPRSIPASSTLKG